MLLIALVVIAAIVVAAAMFLPGGSENYKRCKHCRKQIKIETVTCRYCKKLVEDISYE